MITIEEKLSVCILLILESNGGVGMRYIKMTAKEAIKCLGENTVVLVSVQDLENNEGCVPFIKKSRRECEQMIKDAQTVAKLCDDFAAQLRLYSKKQTDIVNIIPKGKMRTILLE